MAESQYQVALASLQALSRAFATSLFGGRDLDDGGDSSLQSITLPGPCPIVQGQTLFYVDSLPPALASLFPGNGSPQDEPNPCQGLDWYILAYLTLAVHTVSWSLRWVLWEPGARAVAASQQRKSALPRDTVRKISMHLTACLFFTTSAVCAAGLFVHQDWLYQPDAWMDGRDNVWVPAGVKFYYLLYAARFVSDSFSLPFEVGRNATALAVAGIHHFVTLGLIFVGISRNYMRGTAVIMFFFDWADPPLLLAKACKHMSAGQPNDVWQTTANRLFEVFAVLFFVSRNVLYTFVAYTFCRTLPSDDMAGRVFLILLVGLQTYWMALIVQAAVRMKASSDGNVEDVRDDDDNNNNNEKKKRL